MKDKHILLYSKEDGEEWGDAASPEQDSDPVEARDSSISTKTMMLGPEPTHLCTSKLFNSNWPL
jgi:hypothetical protein